MPALTRRLLLLTLPLLPPSPATAQDAALPGEIRQLSERAWALVAGEPGSSNGLVLAGDTATLVVDPGASPARARRLLTAAVELTGRVDVVVLTHGHPDHALGVVCDPTVGARVIAHPLTRRFLAENERRFTTPSLGTDPEDAEALATCRPALPEPVEGRVALDLGDHVVEILHPGPAHTVGDLAVWSPDERVLATGDLFIRGSTPYIGGGNVLGWIAALDRLAVLDPAHVVPGHFEVSTAAHLGRFRDYLSSLVRAVEEALGDGLPPAAVAGRVSLPAFADLDQYPEFGATLEANARAVAEQLVDRPAAPGDLGGFRHLAELDVGLAPHQIAFAEDGATAFVAAAGSDRITHVDVRTLTVVGSTPVPGTPLGVSVLPGDRLLVSRFGGSAIARYDLATGALLDTLDVGGTGASLFAPLPRGRRMFSVEQTDRVWVVDGATLEVVSSHPVGRRPFPTAATSDGRLAFVPGYEDGTVTVIDLRDGRVRTSAEVGANPSGGVVLPGDREYVAAVRGQDRLAFVDVASFEVTGSLEDGIGDSPFSVVLTPDGRLAFVNNTASHDVSVLDVERRRVVARLPVPEQPIVVAVHPSGETLWVSSEGEAALTVFEIPERWR